MDKLDEETAALKNLRYSIPTLLWIGHLCQTNKTPFDLSRLSFAVFHAGFVKPSGACARKLTMPLQDISVNRNRGWSLDTASSAEDYVLFSGSGRRLIEPRRQPVNAPGSPGGRTQVDEGFVRFLKTHSSPTHQRVTAGGRIVPMEPPLAPPPYKLLVDNSNSGSLAPAPPSTREGSVRREQHWDGCGMANYNEHKSGTRKSFNPAANFQVSQGQHLLAEPFPKFYDGQTGHQDVPKAAIDNNDNNNNNNSANLSKNTGAARNVARRVSHGPGTGQNTARSGTRGVERPLPNSTVSEARATQPRQNHLATHGATSTGHTYPHPQYLTKVQGSHQQAPITSPYKPNTMSPLLDEISTTITPELSDNGPDLHQHSLSAEMGPYQGLDLANQALLYPSLFPMLPQGFQLPQFAGLPLYVNQLGYVPAAYYTPDAYNQSASLLSALALQPFADASVPVATPLAVNTGVSEAPNQVDLQQQLASAEASFNHSTEQERNLDQYLAMNMDKMDLQTRRACTGKRMQIVEERAAAKDLMNQLQQALEMDLARTTHMQADRQSLASLGRTTQSCPANRLNVQAPSWVPKAGSDGNKAVKIQNPKSSATTAPIPSSQRVRLSPTNVDRPKSRPVTPDNAVADDPFTAKPPTVVFSPEKSLVDEWGARLGAAPPELERQQSEQSEILESMASEASQASARSRQSIGNRSAPDCSWDTKHEHAPRRVEADRERFLGAICKDVGAITLPPLRNGENVKVEGQNYRPPKTKYMSSELENNYWLLQPDAERPREGLHSRPLAHSFEKIKYTPSPQKCKQTQEWVNGVAEVHKPLYSGRAPWISEGLHLLSAKGEPSISLQDTYATSKTRGINGAAGHLRGRY